MAFGYVAHPMDLPWDRERHRSFADTLALNGFPCSMQRLPSLEMKDRKMVSGLKAYLRAIPKPCGILAANDEIAALVIAIALKLGLSVPDDVSVVGIDDNPTYVKHGVVHYAVANMPGAVPRTSTVALTNVTVPYALEIANKGAEKAILENPALKAGVNTANGHITYEAVARDLNYGYVPAELAIENSSSAAGA